MREEDLIDLEQGSFIVDEQVQQITPILVGKVIDLDPVLGQLSKFEQTLFELLGLFSVLVYLLELLLAEDLVLQPTLHDIFSDFLDALYE